MKLPAFLSGNPKDLLKKLIRVSSMLFVLMMILMAVKYHQEEQHKADLEREARHKMLAEVDKTKQEVNWEEQIKTILPEQEELLTPNVVPKLLIPPLLNKIEVPQALVYERKKRYTAAYELQKTRPIAFWGTTQAAAGGVDLSTQIRMDLPAISPPLTKESTEPRKPKPPKGVGQTYILLP